MGRTRQSDAIEAIENTISHLVAADISYRMIAERSDDPHIINEVRNGRGHLAAAHRALLDERTTYTDKEQPNEQAHRP